VDFKVFCLILFFCFAGYFFLNPFPHGVDSYFYLSSVCGRGFDLSAEPVLTRLVFSVFPCDLFLVKILQFCSVLVAVLAVIHIAKIFHKDNYVLAGLFVFFAPVFLAEFAKFESELFAFPLLFWADYFVLRGLKEGLWKWQALGLFFVLVASGFWQGAVFYLIPFGLMSVLFSPFLLAAILLFKDKMDGNIFVKAVLWESSPYIGLTFLGLFLVTFLGLVFEPLVFLPGFFWLVLTCFNAKFAVHAVPFLAVGVLNLYNNKNFNNLDKKFKQPIWETVKIVLKISGVVLMVVVFLILAFFWPPTIGQIGLVKEFVDFQEQGYDTKNDWGFGYWVRYWGGEPTAWGGGEWIQDYNTGVILTGRDLNCLILGQANRMFLYDCNELTRAK